MLDLQALRMYGNWIKPGVTARDVYQSVIAAGGWARVFTDPLPIWASRVRQYFNLNPMTLKLLDKEESSKYLKEAQKALPASGRAQASRKKLQDRGMGIWFHAPGNSTRPGTPLVKPDPNDAIDTFGGHVGTKFALSGDVYEDELGRSIWFQMTPGGGIYHKKGQKVEHPRLEAVVATAAGQEYAPNFKLVSPDGTGGSRECCILNPFNVRRTVTKPNGRGGYRSYTEMVGRTTIGAVNEVVNVADRFEKDSVAQGSYNYAETTEKGLPTHDRLDVNTDPMKPGYYVEPPDLFKYSELLMRRFPPNDRDGKPLEAQTGKATRVWP